MGSLHMQYASIFFLLLSYRLHPTLTLALPIDPQSPTTNLLQLSPSHNLSASNELSVEQNVGNLLRYLATHEDRDLNQAKMLSVILRVDDIDPSLLTASDDIASFRKIDCIFRYGSVPRGFVVENRWPDHWDRWKAPVTGIPHQRLLPVSWHTISTRMSVEWADVVLKRRHRGRYRAVVLLQPAGRPLGWCFDSVELGNGWIGSVLVETTGYISTTDGCLSLL